MDNYRLNCPPSADERPDDRRPRIGGALALSRRRWPWSASSARSEEADAIRRLVTGAYAHYVERMGKLPGPMLDGYSRASRTSRYGWWEY